ncbi:cupin domain-containing protein [candidate division KSB1 bacterium]|nr:cupin domain-containing protein [candidate division KSB1 bacterium]
MKKVSLEKMTDLISTFWAPLDVFRVNDFTVRLVKINGVYIWHKHNYDELFIVRKGSMIIHFKDHDINLHVGEGFVVEEGKVHQTEAKEETEVMVVEHVDTETITV